MSLSLIVRCDGCNEPGKRRRGYMVPEHWHYIESKVAHSTRGQVHIVFACSDACRDSLWRRGPGPGDCDERGTERMRKRGDADDNT